MISERDSLQNAAENWKREAERVTAVAVKRQAEIASLREVLKRIEEQLRPIGTMVLTTPANLAWETAREAVADWARRGPEMSLDDHVQPERCERCSEPGIAHNDDGVWLCEDCLFQEATEAAFPDLIGYSDRD